ncbi:MAG: STM3941 family protein [Pseudomonadota bacterium]
MSLSGHSNDTEDEVEIFRSKGKMLLLLIGALAFVAMGIWMLTLSGDDIRMGRRFNNPIFVKAIGIVAIVFFGYCAFFAFRKLLDNAAALVISSEGLVDNASGLAPGVIRWSEITDIGEYMVQRQRFIAILLVDPEAFVEKSGRLARMLARANASMSGTPVNIPTNALRIDHEELLSLLHERWSASRAD